MVALEDDATQGFDCLFCSRQVPQIMKRYERMPSEMVALSHKLLVSTA